MDEATFMQQLAVLYALCVWQVDGMGAGDRGGMAALGRTITLSKCGRWCPLSRLPHGRMVKKTRNPVICICNDSHSPKARGGGIV